MDKKNLKQLINLQIAIQWELIPELKGIEENQRFTWRAIFERTRDKEKYIPQKDKAKILSYLETCRKDKTTLLSIIQEQFIQLSREQNRKDIIPHIAYALEEIRKNIPAYLDLCPCKEYPRLIDIDTEGARNLELLEKLKQA